MGRKAGQKNRNYPPLALDEALVVARAIQDQASGMPVSRLTLAQILDRSPSSSEFRDLLFSSRAYGLTSGGVNAEHFELTSLGHEVTGADEVAVQRAKQRAVLTVDPFNKFFSTYDGKKVPSSAAWHEFLVTSADVPAERASDCIEHIRVDAQSAGLLRSLKGADYVDLAQSGGGGIANEDARTDGEAEESNDLERNEVTEDPVQSQHSNGSAPVTTTNTEEIDRPKKVFIAHGKNRSPLEQLKKVLDQFKVKYAVAVDEPNKGRPISAKVANLMRDECSSAIFIFTADERFVRETDSGEHVEVWRPSENVVYELGAASVLYDRRIVIFKESAVTFPSDFNDLGYIEFQADQLAAKTGDLFAELVALDVLEVRAKS